MRALLTAALVGAALIAGAVAQTPQAPAPPASNSPAALIRVDAVVTDVRGRPVADLKADDFTIVEDGVAGRVEAATFVSGGAGPAEPSIVPVTSRADEQSEAGRPGARLFAIFMDEYHVAAGDESDQARALVTRLIERDMGPRDLAVIVKPLDSLLNLRMTHDRAALLGAVQTFEGRKGEYAPKNDFEKNYFAAAPARIEDVRSQIVTSALDALAIHVGGLQPGRKTLLVVSDGFNRAPRLREEALPTIDIITRTANRAGVAIYAVDPRALAPASSSARNAPDPQPEHATLKTLAGETDGNAIFGPADAAKLTRFVNDVSAYYLLAFHPAHPNDTRTFHTIDVRVKRPNIAVHARPGYWAASADDLLKARTDRRVAATPPPQPMRHASPLIRPWFGVARASETGAADRSMQVSFVWEPVPPVPGDRSRKGPPALVTVKASRMSDGFVVFEGNVRPSYGDGAADAAPQQVAFDTPPGRLLLQLAIHDADQNVLDTDVRDVIVGALAGPVEVGTPEVLRAESARAYRAIEDDPDAVPVATREFRRADRLLIRLPVYTAGAPPTVTATLSSKPGSSVMRQLPIERMDTGADYQADLSLAPLPAGEYAITVNAASSDGTASETVAFRIVP